MCCVVMERGEHGGTQRERERERGRKGERASVMGLRVLTTFFFSFPNGGPFGYGCGSRSDAHGHKTTADIKDGRVRRRDTSGSLGGSTHRCRPAT